MNTLKNLLSLNDDERLLAEVRTYQEKLISNAEEPIWERKWLTIEEAAAYSGIGRTKLRELSNQAGCPFAIWIGNKIHIVRERLDKYIDKTLIAITTLPPRAMMGIDSCGMLLSAIHEEEGEEKLHLLMVDPHIPAGAKLY